MLVEVDPSPPPHPFRFYGYRILEGRQLEYRVHFAETVDMQEAAEALSAMHWLEESPYELEVETQGHFAHVVFEHDVDDITEFEDWLVEHFLEVHQRFPILEVLHLFIAEADSPWQTWSSETQWPPDEGPMFGVDWPLD